MVGDHDINSRDTQENSYYLVHPDHVGDLERAKCQDLRQERIIDVGDASKN